MANRTFKPLNGTNGNGKRLLTFQVKPNGVSTPTLAENGDNVVASVSRSGVGTYTITLTDPFLALAAIHCQVQLSAAADTQVQITGTTTVATTKQIGITILTAGAAADIAANAANILHFTCVMRDSSGQ
jgi:hypothetical protein